MKLRIVFALFFSLLGAVLFMSNKNGRASTGQRGSTGAPGDETVSGQLRTCQNCHAGGNYQLSLSLDLLNADSSAATFYEPNKEYTARVRVNKLAGSPVKYGFQMIAIKAADGTEFKGFSTPSSNAKITTITSGSQSGRSYAEHKTSSTSNVFYVKWKAPTVAAGAIDFYVAGVGVNDNAMSGSDAGVKLKFTLPDQSTATENALDQKAVLRAVRNPLAEGGFLLQIENAAAGERLFEAFDLAGKAVFSKKLDLAGGLETIEIDAASWANGLFFVRMSQKGRLEASVKLVKF